MVPSIAVMPRDGSFALAFFGRMRKVHDLPFSPSAGRKSFALKRIEGLVTLLGTTVQVPGKQQLIQAQWLFETRSQRGNCRGRALAYLAARSLPAGVIGGARRVGPSLDCFEH